MVPRPRDDTPLVSYPFKNIEAKWQKRWLEQGAFTAEIDPKRPKYYVLDMFPYPSADGLHVGHVEGYTASDIVARFKRAQGFNVLHPMGWDAYGLPAEQFAIQTGIHPEVTTQKSMQTFRRQLQSLGFSYDWQREIATCDPQYYRFTQAIFLELHQRGLAYQKDVAVNWCPALMTVLANEEVVDGKSERGGHPVERRPMRQWMLKITSYAQRLLDDLDQLAWSERTKEAQRHWIGKSSGMEIDFPIVDAADKLTIFTTRADTIYGVTFMVLAPEHPLVSRLTTPPQRAAVLSYQQASAARSELARQSATEKTGVFTGAFVRHPLTQKNIPIWVADYVLMDYGSGAIMAVPGHDERDFAFAQKFSLPIIPVIDGGELPFTGQGAAINSPLINGLSGAAAMEKMAAHLESHNLGRRQTQYKLRDWLFSRQRYWGEPFPVIHYPQAGLQTVPANELPVLLPPVASYAPTADGKAPLSRASRDWLEVKHPQTGEIGQRETDTMPGSAGSSWYFLRFTDPHNAAQPFSFAAQAYWMPVDLYIGGAEHTVGHLLYARFWQKVLYDAGLVTHAEPFVRLVHQGMILGEDGEKMSKSRGNVISPDQVISEYGADSLRLYEMFMGPIDRDKPWATNGIVGVHKFLNRLWTLLHPQEQFQCDDAPVSEALLRLRHQSVAKISRDLEQLSFNTAISQLMIWLNALISNQCRNRQMLQSLVQCLAPLAPHIAEELWEKLGMTGLVAHAPWPTFDAQLAKDEVITLAVQVAGKLRGTIEIQRDAEQASVEPAALAIDAVNKALNGQTPKKVIFVKNRIINFIV